MAEEEQGAASRGVKWPFALFGVLGVIAIAVALLATGNDPSEPVATTQAGEGQADAGAPDASFTHTCESVTCSFQDESADEGTVTDWIWDFGDGETLANEPAAVHAYPEPGVYRVSLTVADDAGNLDIVTRAVSVGAPEFVSPTVETVPPVYPFGPHIGSSGGWELVEDPFTTAHINGYRDSVIELLNAARTDGKSLILHLPGTTGSYRNPDGTFSLELWKAGVDEFADIDFTPWIEDGTLLVHYLISEPMSRSRWGNEVVTVEVLDEMARYSKQLWPNLPTTVREQPTDLILHAGGYETPVEGWEWTYLDSGWARYLARKGPVEEFIEAEVAAAKAQGLGLLFGMNVLSGGDGSSERIGYDGKYVMSAEEALEYGTKLINEPYGCAMVMWHLNFDDIPYFNLPKIQTVMDQLGEVARAREPIPCS